MSITITAERMISNWTSHWAEPTVPGHEYGTWTVSWLPEQPLDRNQAITAMVLAETLWTHDVRPGGRWWPHIRCWAGELGLTAADAVARAGAEPSVEAVVSS